MNAAANANNEIRDDMRTRAVFNAEKREVECQLAKARRLFAKGRRDAINMSAAGSYKGRIETCVAKLRASQHAMIAWYRSGLFTLTEVQFEHYIRHCTVCLRKARELLEEFTIFQAGLPSWTERPATKVSPLEKKLGYVRENGKLRLKHRL